MTFLGVRRGSADRDQVPRILELQPPRQSMGRVAASCIEIPRYRQGPRGPQDAAGPVPKTLRPIFRDREDFSAGHSLTEQTLAALEASQFLIVVCSPNAARSQYVNEEIRRFKAMGRADRVLPVIVDGEPGDAERECFPPALWFKIGADGTLSDEREVPARGGCTPARRRQGSRQAEAGCRPPSASASTRSSDAPERARRRHNRFWAALAGVFLFLAVAASGSAVYAYQKLINRRSGSIKLSKSPTAS